MEYMKIHKMEFYGFYGAFGVTFWGNYNGIQFYQRIG